MKEERLRIEENRVGWNNYDGKEIVEENKDEYRWNR